MLTPAQRPCSSMPVLQQQEATLCGVLGGPRALFKHQFILNCSLAQPTCRLRRPNLNSKHTAAVAALATAGRIAPSQERQQHVARDEAAERRRKSVNVAKLLTNHIVAAGSLEQLHGILVMHANSLDHIHVAAMLSRTAQISLSLEQQRYQQPASPTDAHQQLQQPEQQQSMQQQQQLERQQLLVSKLTEMVVQRLRHAKAHTLVAAVAALGRLSTIHSIKGPSASQLHQFAVKAQVLLPAFNLSELAVVIWGLAKAGYKPQSSWLEPVLAEFMQQYKKLAAQQEQERKAQEAEHQQQQQQQQQQQHGPRLQRPVLPISGKQGQRTAHVLSGHTYQRPHQHTLATDLSLVIYSLAVMGKQPTAAWLAEWQAAMLQQLPAANMQDLSQSLWGLANLGVGPDEAWLGAVLSAAEPSLSSAGVWSLCSLLGALARLNHTPQQHWLAAYLAALQEQQSLAANPQAFSSCLSSLARLKVPVDASILSSLTDSSTDHLPAYSPWQLTNTCWACATMHFKPSASWIKKFLAVTARLADSGRFTVAQLSSVIWSLALIQRSGDVLLASQQLQIMVLLQAMTAAAGGQGLKQLGPNGRSGLAWALASLGIAPARPWLEQYLSACFEGGLAEDHVRCANVLFCVAALDYEYLVEWLEGFLSGGASPGGTGELDLSLEKYAALVGVLQALSEIDSKQLRAAWLDLSSTDWSAESAAGGEGGMMGFSVQLPASLASWVDSMVAPAATSAPGPAAAAAEGEKAVQ